MEYCRQNSSSFLCASMCTNNPNCDAYYYEASKCYEANASSLVGSASNLPTSKNVYIDQNIYRSNKGHSSITHCDEESLGLTNHYIPANGDWMWKSWSTCSTTCGTGIRTRIANSCNGPFYAGMPCSGNAMQTENCTGEYLQL